MLVNKKEKKAVAVDVAIPNDCNLRKKEEEKLGEYQGLKEEQERKLGAKVSVVPVVIGALRAVTPKFGEWLKQIPGLTFEISLARGVQSQAQLRSRTGPSGSRASGRGAGRRHETYHRGQVGDFSTYFKIKMKFTYSLIFV